MSTSSTQTNVTTCPLHEVDTFSAEFLQHPHPFYRPLREEAPAFRDPKNNVVYISTYGLLMEVLAKPKRLQNMRLVGDPLAFRYVPSILLRGVERLDLAFDPA